MFHHRSTLAAALLVGLAWPTLVGCSSTSEKAQQAFNVYDADKRRQAISELSAASFGGAPVYLRLYRTVADDPDPTVRAACAQALGLHGHPTDGPLLVTLLRDDEPFVRWCAAGALQKINDPQAAQPLVRALGHDDDADVRMTAAHALGQYPRPAVFDALVGALNDPDFGVVHAARGALVTLTGHRAGIDGRDWLGWSRAHRAALFANRQVYTYAPYPALPGPLTRWATWWAYSPPPPRSPAGIVADTPANRG